MSPYNPRASAKMRISIIPTNILSCWPSALTPASPTIPIAIPAPYYLLKFLNTKELKPQQSPAAKCANPKE